MDIMGYKFQEGLSYDRDHGWVKEEGDFLTAGVSDFFQKTAGEIIFIEVPRVGKVLEKGQPYSSIESGKWVGRLKAPVNGEIVAVNSELNDCPYLLNDSPYEEGWIVKIKPSNKAELRELFSLENNADDFKVFIDEEDRKIKEGKKS